MNDVLKVLSNRKIARRNSEAVRELLKKTGELLKSPEMRKRQREACRKSPLCAAATKRMMEAMRKTEKCQAGLKHHAGRKWYIRSPSNVEYHFVNLLEFIRSNPHLFDPDDIPVKAHRGIGMLRPSDTRKYIAGSWKGWTWISYCETFYNSSNDLLDRNVENK
jgi:hypothetical protein